MRKFNRPLAAVAGVGLSVLVAMGAPIGSAVTAVAAPTSGLVAAEIGVGSTPANPDEGLTTLTPGVSEQPDATTPPASPDATPPGGGEDEGAITPDPPADGDQSDDGVQDPSGDLAVGRPGPDLELGADSSGFMPMSVPVGAGEDLYYMPDPGRAYLAFDVKDTLGNLVPGATVNIQGPRSGSTSSTSDRWGAAIAVTDCTTGAVTCPAGSLDQDSRPGKFAVDRLVANGSIESGKRYRIGASGTSPAGYQWTTLGLTGLTDASDNVVATIAPVRTNDETNINTALSGQWVSTSNLSGTGANMVHTFFAAPVLQRLRPSCSADVVYAVSSGGQIQQLVKGTGKTAVITTVGSALSGASSFNGLGIGPDGTNVYGYNRNSNNAKVYKFNISMGTWAPVTNNASDLDAGGSLVAGAVAPDGVYYMGLFATNTTFKLWKLVGSTVSVHGTVTLPNSSSNGNGDMAFDSAGNLYIVRGVNNGTSLETFLVTKSNLALANTSIPSTRIFNGNAPFSSVNGVAYDSTGKLYVGGSSAFGYATLPSPSAPQQVTISGGTLSSTDLATCSYPPTVKLQKTLPEGRAVATDRFGLEILEGGSLNNGILTGGTSLGTATASTPALGLQDQTVGPIPAGTGTTISIRETFLNGAIAANYASSWQCTVGGVAVPGGSGMGAVGQFTIPATNQGEEVLCTFTNTALGGEKTSNPASGQVVTAGQVVTYTLTFDNRAGVSPITVDFRDHLADVLDDAGFVDWTTPENSQAPEGARSTPDPNYGGSSTLTMSYDSVNQWMNIGGSVPAGGTSTVSLKVRVKGNDEGWKERQGAQVPLKGYLLRNYLTRGTVDTPPTSCESPSVGMPRTCTEHPVRAWTIEKNSQPGDGAMVHSGANIYYRVKITNFSGETMNNVQLVDDLTSTLFASRFAPDAPAGPLPNVFGVTYHAENGAVLGGINWNDPTTPGNLPEYSGNPNFITSFPDDGNAPFEGTWTLTTSKFDIPGEIGGTPVAYAVVGYPVQVGFVADPEIAGGTKFYQHYGTHSEPALPNAWWVNTATGPGDQITFGSGTEPVAPNRCETREVTLGWDQNEKPENQDPDCKTYHSLGEGFFHLWKKESVLNEGNNNLLASEFLLSDTEELAKQGVPSRWLCHKGNDPYSSSYVAPGAVDPGSVTDWDYGASSADASGTYANILKWNSEQTDPAAEKELCGLWYSHNSGDAHGQPVGSWHGQALRGGDIASDRSPLPNWRTESAANNGAGSGFHGTYWVVETAAPSGFQLLAQPMKLWIAPRSITPDNLNPLDYDWYSYQNRLSLPVVGEGESASSGEGISPGHSDNQSIRAICDGPWTAPASGQPACIMPTGWTMPVFDVKLKPLPLTGGTNWAPLLGTAGGIVLIGALGGTLWWRRRQGAQLAGAATGGDYRSIRESPQTRGGRHSA